MDCRKRRVDMLKAEAADRREKHQVTEDREAVVQVEFFPQREKHREVDQNDHGEAAKIEKLQLLLGPGRFVEPILAPDPEGQHHGAFSGYPDVKRLCLLRGKLETQEVVGVVDIAGVEGP